MIRIGIYAKTLVLCSLIATGCGQSANTAKGLVSIHDAPDICPNKLCPIGTEIFRKDGEKRGIVNESSETLSFPDGSTKPGMSLRNPELTNGTVLYKIDTEQAKNFYVNRP